MSLDLILPFLAPADKYVLDAEVSELMFNGDGSIFVERGAGMERVLLDRPIIDLRRAIKRIAGLVGREINENRPLLNARLSDGSRVAAVWTPCSVGAPAMSIRKFRPNWYTLAELVVGGTLSGREADQLVAAVHGKKTILVSGGTFSGKTTLMKALIDEILREERLVIIEDTQEIAIDPANNPNVQRFVARPELNSAEAVSVRDLVKQALRFRPDRIIVGEVRGGEAFDLLDALNTGHAGSISTVHANSGPHALRRLASLAMRAAVDVPYAAIQQDIADLIDIVVHIARDGDGRRRVVSIETM